MLAVRLRGSQKRAGEFWRRFPMGAQKFEYFFLAGRAFFVGFLVAALDMPWISLVEILGSKHSFKSLAKRLSSGSPCVEFSGQVLV